jgi:hypothetical protein
LPEVTEEMRITTKNLSVTHFWAGFYWNIKQEYQQLHLIVQSGVLPSFSSFFYLYGKEGK